MAEQTVPEVKIEESWKEALQEEFGKEYFNKLISFLKEEKAAGHIIYPPGAKIFEAFSLTPIEQVKVVILGQDPYHGPGQAMGLCFSVPDGIQLPPSLQNIFKELATDLGIQAGRCGDLTKWAKQGVFLLNAILTVRKASAASHQNHGWEQFTDAVIKTISDVKENVVFILWGNYAGSKQKLIDTSKHHIIKSPHPSPLSAYGGFFGSKPFSKTNDFLESKGLKPVDWSL
jgi:uracil-DNA glycosylase